MDNYDVTFHDDDRWNLPQTVPVPGMEGMVTPACLHHTRNYITPDICSLIKPTAMEKIMSFPTKMHALVL